jgi:hypothetical protein
MTRKADIRPAPAKFGGGQLRVSLKDRPSVIRANRQAAGLQACTGASKQQIRMDRPDVLRLVVYGTLDELGRQWWFKSSPARCPCCGATTHKRIISECGRARLAQLRKQKEARNER